MPKIIGQILTPQILTNIFMWGNDFLLAPAAWVGGAPFWRFSSPRWKSLFGTCKYLENEKHVCECIWGHLEYVLLFKQYLEYHCQEQHLIQSLEKAKKRTHPFKGLVKKSPRRRRKVSLEGRTHSKWFPILGNVFSLVMMTRPKEKMTDHADENDF